MLPRLLSKPSDSLRCAASCFADIAGSGRHRVTPRSVHRTTEAARRVAHAPRPPTALPIAPPNASAPGAPSRHRIRSLHHHRAPGRAERAARPSRPRCPSRHRIRSPHHPPRLRPRPRSLPSSPSRPRRRPRRAADRAADRAAARRPRHRPRRPRCPLLPSRRPRRRRPPRSRQWYRRRRMLPQRADRAAPATKTSSADTHLSRAIARGRRM